MATIRQLIATEFQEQVALVQWMNMQPRIRDFVIKLNNEGKRTPLQGHNLNRLGMHKGASDIFLAFPTREFRGLWLEVKRNKKYTPSERNTDTWKDEELFQLKMKSVGYDAHFCYGWEHGVSIIESYLWVPPAA